MGRGGARITADSVNQRLIREAVDSAKQADVVVLMLGATARMMHEAWGGNDGDNDDLELRGMQNELAEAIKATGKPVVVMLFSGGPLTFARIDRAMPAILYCWYLGQETGHAVADVLFGDVNPSGRLAAHHSAQRGSAAGLLQPRAIGAPLELPVRRLVAALPVRLRIELYDFSHGQRSRIARHDRAHRLGARASEGDEHGHARR